MTSFVRNGANRLTANGSADSLEVASGAYSYFYRDQTALLLEAYDATGSIQMVVKASGEAVTVTYSTSSTAASIAPGPGYLISLSDAFGRTVSFAYITLANGLVALKSATEAGGSLTTFQYDTAGNLQYIVWPDLTKKGFAYGAAGAPAWALTGITDENAAPYASITYDPVGWASASQLGSGANRSSVSYSTPPKPVTREVLDTTNNILWRYHEWVMPQGLSVLQPSGASLGLQPTALFGAVAGQGAPYLTSKSQPAGSGCGPSTSSLTFDGSGNLASQDNFNGSRTCYANDASRNLELDRVEGLTGGSSGTLCGSVTGAGAALPAGARKVSTTWHPDWRFAVQVAEPGRLTTSVYNGQPDPLNGNAVASCAPTTALLPDGKPVAVLCKQVEQATSDANGTQGLAVQGSVGVPADPSFSLDTLLLHMDGGDGSTNFADSSASAKTPSSVIAPVTLDGVRYKSGSAAGNFTGGYLLYAATAGFDMAGGDFTIEAWVRFNDASVGSRAIVFGQSDASGSNPTVSVSKSTSEVLTFLVATTVGTYGYTGTIPVVPNTWYHIAVVRGGNTVTLYRNGTAELTGTVSGAIPTRSAHFGVGVAGDYAYAYGGAYGTQMMGWIDEFRITKGLARYTTAFTPPSNMGGATTVPGTPSSFDASVPARVRSWTYNQYGQVLTETDPLGNKTTSAYYADTSFTGTDPNAVGHTTGDLQSVTNALGKATLYTQYDKHGNVLQSSDANGVVTVNTYDLRQRLLSTSVGGQATSYAYDPAGQLLKVTSPDASWIGYEYDPAHRLVATKDSLGNRIDYTLDNAGNRTAQTVKDPGGNLARSAAKSFDALGRVQQTTGRE